MAFYDDFKRFALRGNLVDIVIGFTVGAAFTTVAKSLVDDVLMPPLGLILGQADFSNYYWLLKEGSPGAPYATQAAADASGAVTLNYGAFFTNVITFLIVTFAVFILIRLVNRASDALEDEFGNADESDGSETPETKKCSYCREAVPYSASRCPRCTSFLGKEGGPLTPDAALTPGPALVASEASGS